MSRNQRDLHLTYAHTHMCTYANHGRFSKESALHDLKTRCFVCDLTALRLEQDAGIDFETHTEKVHNPQLYLYFLIHLKGLEQSPADMTAVERFVADKVWGKAKNVGNINVEWLPNTTWMPRSTKDNDHQHIQVEPDCNDCMHAQMDKLMN